MLKEHKNPVKYKPGDVLISEIAIKNKIKEIATKIAKKYLGEHLIIVGILKGAFILTADLARELYKQGFSNFSVEFITVSTYEGTKSSGTPRITTHMETDPKNQHVLIVDDVIETALTLSTILSIMKNDGAKSIRSFVLLSKPATQKLAHKPDFVGFSVPNVWVQGYGMDTDQLGRGNPNVIVGPYKG